MASVTYDGQSFSIDGRRVWILGASIEYARVPPEVWADRIAAASQAGFNTVATPCPWLVHEPRKGRFSFHGPTDVRAFVELCGEAGMWVMLRPGPFVGAQYDAGGLPSWLLEMPGVALREANEPFLERVGLYHRKLLGELADLQVSHGGPILLVQSEHAWLCSNQTQADKYLQEITRYLKESGINVPIVNANDLWQESAGTIDTWRGREELLVHLRQLRLVQPKAPRIVSQFNPGGVDVWGETRRDDVQPEALMQWLAQVLAAGAQPVVWPFHGGTNFGFLGGRQAGRPDGFVTTNAAAGAPLGETGTRGAKYVAIKRLINFANQFSYVLAELSPDYHPVSLDLGELDPGPRAAGKSGRRVSIVHLRGGAGQVVFVFSDGIRQEATLLLEEGIRLPVTMGDQSVGWYLVDVDLRGSGRLDYASLCPYAIVDRSILVLQGPARATAFLSIDGSPLQVTVPTGGKPVVLQHMRVTVVICNHEQIDETYHNDTTVFVGAGGLAADGSPLAGKKGTTVWAVTRDAKVEKLTVETGPRAGGTSSWKPIEASQWQAAPADAYTRGDSPRFASLEGPETLASCGAPLGYGWYRIQLKTSSAGKRRWALPESADRVHVFLDGQHLCIAGVGRGAQLDPFEQHLGKGQHTIVALVDNLGRFAEGNDLGERKGLFGHIQDVKRMASIKPRKVVGKAVDPFSLRGYIAGRTFGQLSDTSQIAWTFTHTRKSSILVAIDGAEPSATLVLNDRPVAYYAGASGGCFLRLLLKPGVTEGFRRGRNELRFAPDLRQDNAVEAVSRATTLYECVETISAGASWAFAKWEPPPAAAYQPISRTAARSLRGTPCWWRSSFVVQDVPVPVRVDTTGLSKGSAFLNGHNLGRYFTATTDGRPVGPQKWLYVPRSWVKPGEHNELLIFDEHGFAPHRVRIVFSAAEERS